jgi:hypothetical protein
MGDHPTKRQNQQGEWESDGEPSNAVRLTVRFVAQRKWGIMSFFLFVFLLGMQQRRWRCVWGHMSDGNCWSQHVSPPNSQPVKLNWWLKTDRNEEIYTLKISKCYKLLLFLQPSYQYITGWGDGGNFCDIC